MPQRYRVASMQRIPPGTMLGVSAGITPVLLANVDGTVYAIQNLCPHLYVPLVLGRLEGCAVVCPAHGSRFDVRTGEVLEWVTTPLPLGAEQLLRLKARNRAASYPVTVVGDDIFVEA